MADMVATLPVEGAFHIDITYKAEEVMANRYVAVKLGTADNEVLLAADGETAIGVLQNVAAAIGDSVRVRLFGLSRVKANTTITKGDKINSGASTGKVAIAGTTEIALGTALEAAGAQNDEITAFICGAGIYMI